MSEAPERRRRFYGIISRPDATPSVLLLPSGAGWSLPSLPRPEGDWTPDDLNRAFGEIAGAHLTILRFLEVPGTGGDEILVMENHGGSGHAVDGAPAAASRWIDRAEFDRLALVPPETRPLLLENGFAEAGENAPIRSPWAVRGWLHGAAAWIAERAGEMDARSTGLLPAQINTNTFSCVLRASTTAGDLFFKAVSPLFAPEAPLTRVLAEHFPGDVPDIVAHDPERHWILMRPFEGVALADCPDAEAWEGTARRLAAMQMAFIGRADALRACGCPERGLAELIPDLERWLAEGMGEGGKDALTLEEQAALRERLPRIRVLADALASHNIPDTLVHGDLHAWNVAIRAGGRPLLYDWTDGATAPPFFDLFPLLPGKDSPRAALRDRTREAYQRPWSEAGYGAINDLRRAADLAGTLALLYQAFSYRAIAENVPDGAGLMGTAHHYLRTLLRDEAVVAAP